MLMRNTTLLFSIMLLWGIAAHAQKSAVKGVVTDTVNKKQLANSSIVILKKADSSLVTFGAHQRKWQFHHPLTGYR